MRLVAIDASTWWGGVALVELKDGTPNLVAELGVHVAGSHAARLLPALEGLLAIASWPKGSIDAYAAIKGPGSFTGVRVGLGLVSGLSLSTGRPCLGVSTLEAMAEAFGPAAGERVPLLDAGRGDVYGARFDPDGSPPQELRPAWVGAPALAIEPGNPVVVFGDGARVHGARLREAGYSGPIGRAPTSVAAAAGRIALTRLVAGDVGAAELAPLYVRPSDAKAKTR